MPVLRFADPYAERAYGVAFVAHYGQPEKDGGPYIRHLERVALALPPHLQAGGLLHDSVEDTDLTIDDLADCGFHPRTITVVDIVSRLDGEPYLPEFIPRICESGDLDAILTKIADVEDHLRPGCEDVISASQIRKYTKALAQLYAARDNLIKASA